MPNALLILNSVSSVGFLSPRSIALKCVLPISANPLKTSCDIFFFFLKYEIVSPTINGSKYIFDKKSPPTQIVYNFFRHFMNTYVDK